MFLEWTLRIITNCPALLNLEEIGCRRGICTVVNTVEDACSRAVRHPFCAESKPNAGGHTRHKSIGEDLCAVS